MITQLTEGELMLQCRSYVEDVSLLTYSYVYLHYLICSSFNQEETKIHLK
jgi:hypothetical protein